MSEIDTLPAEVPPAPAPQPVQESESLSDHEASFSPDAQRAPVTDDDASDRDERGQFKPRRRAVSQRADADDVEAINAHTKRIKTAEESLGKDIARNDGESDRVYNLRRRAELLERQSTAQPTTVTAPTPTAPPAPTRRPQQIPTSFPAYEAFVTIQGNENASYEDYTDARADWRYALRREADRQSDAADTAQRTRAVRAEKYNAALPATKAKYADFDAIVRPDVMVNGSIVAAIMASDHGPEIAYYLGKNHDERIALNAEHPEFAPAAVPALRRYLDSLVATQRLPVSTPTRTAAGPTGAALALAPPPAPRPPTPVRTGSIQVADPPPDDKDMSLDAHEKHFGGRRRR